MSRTVRPSHWLAFAAIVAAGVCLSILINFVLNFPWLTLMILAVAWVYAAGTSKRGPWPFNATIKRLERFHGRAAYAVREFGLPFTFIAGFFAALHVLLRVDGVRGFLGVLAVLYIVDRLAAAGFDYVMRRVEAHRAAKARGDEPAPAAAAACETDGDA